MASIMRHLLHHPVAHRTLVSAGRAGSPVHEPPRSQEASVIKGRIAMAETVLVGEDGKQVNCVAKLYTEAPIGLGDLIGHHGREWTVVKVIERLNLSGMRDHLEVYLK